MGSGVLRSGLGKAASASSQRNFKKKKFQLLTDDLISYQRQKS
jgi:hypothetical protein